MNHRYHWAILALLAGVLVWPAQARAQGFTQCPPNEAVCVVDWETTPGSFEPQLNALLNTIQNDTNRPADRVYKLKRGGFYWNTNRITNDGWHLRIVGETVAEADPDEAFVCGPNFNEDCGPAILQRHSTESGDPADAKMIVGSGTDSDLTLRNLWVMGQTDLGARTEYGPIQLDQADSRIVVDNVVFDRHDWMHLLIQGAGNSVYVTDSEFRSSFGPSQIWEGLGMRFTAGADSIVVENNTFFNIGFTPLQTDNVPANYIRFNHNTLFNIGRSATAGAGLKTMYYTNNLIVNGFWHGENEDQYGDPEREDPYSGFFQIGALPAQYGTDLGREIVLANNGFWRDPAFDAYYGSTNPVVRAQPLVNDTTAGYFARYDNMVMQDNVVGVRPNVAVYPGIVEQMIDHIDYFYFGEAGTNAPRYYFDEGRPTNPDGSECWECNVWPVPENFTYDNAALLTAGTDGLPLGDLNWFPAAKETFEANKAEYVAEIEAMAQAPEVTFEEAVEIESGMLAGGAEIVGYDYPVRIRLREGPNITWTYDAPAAGTYTLRFHYLLDGGEKGQKLTINGEYVPADQSDIMFTGANNEWLTREVEVTLAEGENQIRLIKSWGWMYFRDVDVMQGGQVVETLTAVEATLQGDVAFEKIDAADPAPPSGWNYVSLPSAGSAVTMGYEAGSAGTYSVNVTYSAEAGQQLAVFVNGAEATGSPLFVAPTNGAWESVSVEGLRFNAGANTVEFRAVDGGVSIDKVDVFRVSGAGVGTERDELPEGYALGQNYPNPFNPATSIQYEVPSVGHVSLKVYDVLGRQVMTLVDGQVTAGRHTVRLDGSRLSSGVYFYRLQTAVGQQVRTMILMK